MDEKYKDILALFSIGQNGKVKRESIIEALHAIEALPELPDFPFYQPPTYSPGDDLTTYVTALTTYLATFHYSHLRVNFFSTAKYTYLESIFDTANSIIQNSLPIQCLEATFVALYLSFGIPDLIVFPLGFKSRTANQSHKYSLFPSLLSCLVCRHIVSVVKVNNKFGSFGLSRKETLGSKPLSFDSLFDLVMDFSKCYNESMLIFFCIYTVYVVPYNKFFDSWP